MIWFFGKRKTRIWIGIFAVVDLVVLGFSIVGLIVGLAEQERGIIVSDTATVRISPFAKADSRGTLAEGREVRLGKESNGYFWVTSGDGSQEGWVSSGELAPVNPDFGMASKE